LLNVKWAICQLHHGENKSHFNEMMMYFILYLTNTLYWILIVLVHYNNSPHVTPLESIILISSRPVNNPMWKTLKWAHHFTRMGDLCPYKSLPPYVILKYLYQAMRVCGHACLLRILILSLFYTFYNFVPLNFEIALMVCNNYYFLWNKNLAIWLVSYPGVNSTPPQLNHLHPG
jgi:hypothetical protein